MKKSIDVVWHEGANELYYDRFKALEKYFNVNVYCFNKFRDLSFDSDRSNVKKYDGFFIKHWLTIFAIKMLSDISKNENIIYLHQEPHSLIAFLICLTNKNKEIYLDAAVINQKLNFYGSNFFENYVYKTVKGVFYRNDDVLDILVKRGMPEEKALFRLGNGVSTDTFSINEKHKLSTNVKIKIGYSGRVWLQKGVELLIFLKNNGFDIHYCGPVVDHDLHRSMLEIGCVYHGMLDKDGLKKFYNSIDLFVLPSLPSKGWNEQFGRVIVESIFCGTPAIGSKTGFIPSLVGEKCSFEPGNYGEALKLVDKYSDTNTREKLLSEQYERISSEYSWEAISKKIYEEVNK